MQETDEPALMCNENWNAVGNGNREDDPPLRCNVTVGFPRAKKSFPSPAMSDDVSAVNLARDHRTPRVR